MKLENRIGQLRDEGALAEREGNAETLIRVSAEQTELAKRKRALLTKAEATQMEH
jgi:hypothetical protein